MDDDLEQLQHSDTAAGSIKRHNHLQKCLAVYEKLNVHLPYNPEMPFLDIYGEKWKYVNQKTSTEYL